MNSGKPLTFSGDIRPLFTDTDVAHMKKAGLDLSSQEEVAKNAQAILTTVSSGAMPPPAQNRMWTKEMVETFREWMNQGCPP